MNPSKRKGNAFERKCVEIATAHNIPAKRAWGSNGASLGMHPEVDILIQDFKAQCKTRKHIASYLLPNENVDIQLIKQDRGNIFAVLPYELFLSLISS